jgi:hypothetical protein
MDIAPTTGGAMSVTAFSGLAGTRRQVMRGRKFTDDSSDLIREAREKR